MPRLGCAGEKGWPRVSPWTDLHLQHVAAVQGPGSAAFSADFRAADWLLQALRGVSCRPVQRCAAKTFPTKWAQIPSTVTDSVAAFFPNPWLTFAGLLLRLSFWPLPIKLKVLKKGLAYFLMPAVLYKLIRP